MNFLRNTAFALISMFAIESIFWGFTVLLKFIYGAILLNLSTFWIIITYLLLGGFIMGFIQLTRNMLTMGYMFISRIGTNRDFVYIWTLVLVAIAVAGNSIWIWGTSIFPHLGILGIIAGVFITIEIMGLGIALCRTTKYRLEDVFNQRDIK